MRGLKLGLGGGVRTMRTGAPASSAPFTVRSNTVAATGKGTFERHSHFRLSDTDDFVCCQVSIIIITRGGTASELTSLNRLAGINTSTCQYPGDRPSIVPDAQPLAQEAVIYLYFPTLGIDPKPLNNPR